MKYFRTYFFGAYLAGILGLLLPFSVSAQALQNNDIFGCNSTGATAISIGAFQAVTGSFVPVSDERVTMNTGYLAYKECILRPLVDREREAATSAYVQAQLGKFTTGNNGNPYFVQNYGLESFNAYNKAYNSSFFPVTGNLNGAFQAVLQTALARNYAQTTNQPYMTLACPYTGNVSSVLNGTTNDLWGGISAMLNPSCSPYSAYLLAQNQLSSNAAAAQYAWQTQMNWGNGTYPITDANGNVITPAVLLNAVANQATLSGFQQLQNANDIGQMVGSLFAGLGNQILNAAGGGLAGITTTPYTDPLTGSTYSSYLSGVTTNSQAGVNQAVTNVALSVFEPQLTLEQNYQQALTSLAGVLNNATQNLQNAENTCWGVVVTKVCSGPVTFSASGNTCTTAGGATLHNVATSTKYSFSKPIIDTQIKSDATAVIQAATQAAASVKAMQDLITSMAGTTGATAQQTALQNYDQLKAQGQLHNENDVSALQDQLDPSNTSGEASKMQTLYTNTTNAWLGTGSDGTQYANAWDGSVPTDSSPGVGVGWCNINQQGTIDAWTAKWQ